MLAGVNPSRRSAFTFFPNTSRGATCSSVLVRIVSTISHYSHRCISIRLAERVSSRQRNTISTQLGDRLDNYESGVGPSRRFVADLGRSGRPRQGRHTAILPASVPRPPPGANLLSARRFVVLLSDRYVRHF